MDVDLYIVGKRVVLYPVSESSGYLQERRAYIALGS